MENSWNSGLNGNSGSNGAFLPEMVMKGVLQETGGRISAPGIPFLGNRSEEKKTGRARAGTGDFFTGDTFYP
jgi:hypothetical protein